MFQDYERLIEFDFVRTTEAAALNTLQWLGKGQKEMADEAACDAIRGMFDLMPIKGVISIGEGIKDEAPGLFLGEKVGTWPESGPHFDIALDPVDGTTNASKGMPNSISCIAAAIPQSGTELGLQDIPAFYMDKLSYGQKIRNAFVADPELPLSLDAPTPEVLKIASNILGKNIRDITVIILDRPRNQHYIDAIRSAGANLRLIADGDITAALAPALNRSNIDLYMGIGGSPEGVLTAAALRCLGGGMKSRIWPRDDEERKSLEDAGWGDKIDKTYISAELARGENIVFCATGITDSPLLRGVSVSGHIATTHSVLMRVRNSTVRFLTTHHDLRKKTIYLRSIGGEKAFM